MQRLQFGQLWFQGSTLLFAAVTHCSAFLGHPHKCYMWFLRHVSQTTFTEYPVSPLREFKSRGVLRVERLHYSTCYSKTCKIRWSVQNLEQSICSIQLNSSGLFFSHVKSSSNINDKQKSFVYVCFGFLPPN